MGGHEILPIMARRAKGPGQPWFHNFGLNRSLTTDASDREIFPFLPVLSGNSRGVLPWTRRRIARARVDSLAEIVTCAAIVNSTSLLILRPSRLFAGGLKISATRIAVGLRPPR